MRARRACYNTLVSDMRASRLKDHRKAGFGERRCRQSFTARRQESKQRWRGNLDGMQANDHQHAGWLGLAYCVDAAANVLRAANNTRMRQS